jgi:hypothetical protein
MPPAASATAAARRALPTSTASTHSAAAAERPRAILQCRPQQDDLLTPRVKLCVAVQVVSLDETQCEALHDCLGFARQQFGDITGPPCFHAPLSRRQTQHHRTSGNSDSAAPAASPRTLAKEHPCE